MPFIVGRSAWIAIDHPKSQAIVEKNGNLAGRRRYGLLLADAPCQASVKSAEGGVTSPNRGGSQPQQRRGAARLEDRRVRDESTLPAEILLPGARQSHDVKCLAEGHALRSAPHSPMSFNASEQPRP